MNKILLIILLLACTTSWAETADYCHDVEVAADWDRLLKKYPEDEEIIALYALRAGLCQMIGEGKVALELAIDIFEAEREQVMAERATRFVLPPLHRGA